MKFGTKRFQIRMLSAAALVMGMLSYTRAYAQPGVEAWVLRFHGAGSSYDFPAVAVDGSGNVVVTGASTGIGGSYDFATIKYSGEGVPLWTNRHQGPGNASFSHYPVVLDGSGNVVVTGHTADSSDDFITIKYSSEGVPLWTNRYDGPANSTDRAFAVAVGSNGNVVVTGYANVGVSLGYDCVTIAYSSAGVPLWTNRYNGPKNDATDQPYDMATDRSGNVFVTGSSTYFGSLQFVSDYVTIAYSDSGVPLWTNRYVGQAEGFNQAGSVGVDRVGNVFVTGYSDGRASQADPNNYDYVTIAYSNAGVPLWTNRYNGPANDTDIPIALAVDASGNVIVTGYSIGNGASYDFATIAYSNSGAPLWTNRYNGPGNGNDYAQGVAVDGGGNVIVTGYSLGSGTGYDYATIAYSNAGVPLWTNRYNGPANGDDNLWRKHCLVIAPDGVIVVGTSDGDFGAGTNPDYAVVKYSTVLRPNITAAEKLNNALRLTFTSQPGYHYNVQARTNPDSGDWNNVVTNMPSGGAVTEITFTNALVESQQFYRIQRSP